MAGEVGLGEIPVLETGAGVTAHGLDSLDNYLIHKKISETVMMVR